MSRFSSAHPFTLRKPNFAAGKARLPNLKEGVVTRTIEAYAMKTRLLWIRLMLRPAVVIAPWAVLQLGGPTAARHALFFSKLSVCCCWPPASGCNDAHGDRHK